MAGIPKQDVNLGNPAALNYTPGLKFGPEHKPGFLGSVLPWVMPHRVSQRFLSGLQEPAHAGLDAAPGPADLSPMNAYQQGLPPEHASAEALRQLLSRK